MNSGKISLLFILIFGLSCNPKQEIATPFLVDQLEPGSFKVAFRSFWKLDTSRNYQFKEDDMVRVPQQKRPVLFNIWYPVDKVSGSPMRYENYFDIAVEDPDFEIFSRTLKGFALNVVANEIFDQAYEELDSINLEGYNRLMDKPTAAYSDEPYPRGRVFPLVIYHAGAQSSYDDNSVLCEYLASHGYVVIGSAFQHEDGSSLSVDGAEGSFNDVDFILQESKKLGFINTSEVTLIGHSLGAQMLLMYQAKGLSKVQSIIPIDATFENHSMYDDLFWSEVIGLLKENPEQFTNRFLGISGYDAFYQLYERFEKTDRHYLSIDHLTHNEFISQGVLRKKILEELELETFEPDKSYGMVSQQYAYVCERIVDFISGNPFEPSRSDALRRNYEIQSKGTRGSWKTNQSNLPPSPRQHFGLYEEQGFDAALEVLKSFESTADSSPLFEPSYGYGIVFDLLGQDKINEAKQVTAYFNRFSENGVQGQFQRYIRIGERFKSDFIKDYFQSRLDLLK